MEKTHRLSGRPRRGFSLLEVQAAFIVLAFSMAALVPFAIAQLKLVSTLERRLPPNTSYAVISNDHGIMKLLVAGGGATDSSNPRSITIEHIDRSGDMTRPLDMTATVTIKKKSQ